jgi:hypothetical protein
MTTHRHETQSCRLVSITGLYYTPKGTFSPDPAQALTTDRWLLERHAAKLNTSTVIIRAV